MRKNINEITDQVDKVKEKEKFGLEFVPSKETLDACHEIQDMINGELPKKTYHSFEDMWSDICGT